MKWQAFAMITLLCLFSTAQAQSHDSRLMSTVEYRTVLDKIKAELPRWELSLRSVDPARGETALGYKHMSDLREQINSLSPAEKAELLDTVWESLEADAVSLTDAQRAELDYRISRHEQNPSDVIGWQQVRAGLFKKP